MPIPNGTHFSEANYFRLVLPNLLPFLDKVIYLDSDTLVLGDIQELWKIDVTNFYLAAVNSLNSKKNILRLKISSSQYINSGVMLMNLKKMRNDKVSDAFLSLIKNTNIKLLNVDQDVINLSLDKGVKLISRKWNLELRNDMGTHYESSVKKVINPVILHFLTSDKPWLNKNHPYRSLYYSYM